jgi:peptide/nickel transport system permease protein
MGFLRWVLTKIISYFLALIATISILYLSTYGIIQAIMIGYCEYPNVDAVKLNILGGSEGTSKPFLQQLATSSSAYSNCLSQFGFNQSFPVRFGLQLYRLVTFSFGNSYIIIWNGSHNVGTIIAGYLPNTILLFTTAALILIALGTLIGLLAAKMLGSFWDRLVPIVAMIHSSFPAWWLAMLLIAGLGYGLKILPPYGMTSVPAPTDSLLFGLGVLRHMILPILALLTVGLGGFAYVVRSLVISTMSEDFVLTAKARGFSESRVIFRHVFRTASPAIATQAILATTASLAGAFVTEIVFLWPGIGLLTYWAIQDNDLPVIIGVAFVLALVLFVGLFIGDLVYGLLDPRIKTDSE